MKKIIFILVILLAVSCTTTFKPFSNMDLGCEEYNEKAQGFNIKLFGFAGQRCNIDYGSDNFLKADIKGFVHCVVDELDKFHINLKDCEDSME